MLVKGSVVPVVPGVISSAQPVPVVFPKCEKTAVSVRLRPQKHHANSGGNAIDGGFDKAKGHRLTKNRHSGDFDMLNKFSEANRGGHDWSYVAFVNGVPCPTRDNKQKQEPPVKNTYPPGLNSTPLKVVTHEHPSIISRNGIQNGSVVNRRMSGDFSHMSSRRMPSMASKSNGNEQTDVTKMCNGEFHFQRRPHSAIFEEVGLSSINLNNSAELKTKEKMSKSVHHNSGLGRRSVTQLDIQQRKKDSYNSALCKSQENLVKVDVDDSFRASPDGNGNFKDARSEGVTVRKGLMWQQRDKMFSRWKERYFILTVNYLNCFKKSTTDKISEMGEFLFKLKLHEIEDVELIDKKGYLTICISLSGESNIYLRKTEGIRDWFNSIKELAVHCCLNRPSITKTKLMHVRQHTDSISMQQWLQNRTRNGLQISSHSDSTPEIHRTSVGGTRGGRGPEITLDQLCNLYQREDLEKQQKEELRKSFNLNRLITPVVACLSNQNMVNQCKASPQSLSYCSNKNNTTNFSLTSEIELPDLGIECERGGPQMFLNRKGRSDMMVDAFDSGNNSLNTNASVGSSNSTGSGRNGGGGEDRLETHLEADENSPSSRLKSEALVVCRPRAQGQEKPRPINKRTHMSGLQVTHV